MLRLIMMAAVTLYGVAAIAAESSDIGYDPRANAVVVLEEAVANAAREQKLVLLVSGGDWCVWCHYLHAFLERERAIDEALHEVFVVAKVYVGPENKNADFFSRLPKAAGAPHFWVISGMGQVLASENTLPLEDGAKSYDPVKFRAFIDRWRSHSVH